MKILDYSKYQNVFSIGDIHGDFKRLMNSIKNKLSRKKNDCITHSIMFAAGDVGIGFCSTEYYNTELSKLDKILAETDVILICIRGNHDDPSYFNEDKFNFNNIKFVPDYTVVKTSKYTTLCVGGAISTDRSWRINQERIINKYKTNSSHFKHLYWKDEPFIYNENILNDYKEKGYIIDSVITHTYLRFDKCKTKDYDIQYWSKNDSLLNYDINEECENISKLYRYLNDKKNLKFWCTGHVHCGNTFLNDDKCVIMQLDDRCTINNINTIIDDYYQESTNALKAKYEFIDDGAFDFGALALKADYKIMDDNAFRIG